MTEPVSKHDASQVSDEYKQTLKTLLAFIYSMLKAGKDLNNQLDNQITIQVGKDKVYQSTLSALDEEKELNYQEPNYQRLSEDNIKQIQTAIANPQQLKGSVSILIGNKRIFQVQNGKVQQDDLKLVTAFKQLNKLPNTESTNVLESQQEKQKENREHLENPANPKADAAFFDNLINRHNQHLDSIQELPANKEQLEAIKRRLDEQQKTLSTVQTQLQQIIEEITLSEKTEKERPKLSNLLRNAQVEGKNHLLKLQNKIKEILTPRVEKLQREVEQRLLSLEEKIVDVENRTKLKEEGREVVQYANKILTRLGRLNPETKDIECVTNNYCLTWHDKSLSITTKEGKEVVNENGFTKEATQEDINKLKTLEQVVEKLQLHVPAHQYKVSL